MLAQVERNSFDKVMRGLCRLHTGMFNTFSRAIREAVESPNPILVERQH